MKQLIEEQKKEFDAFRCTCVRKCGEFDPDHNSPDEVWNWHKQSLKQFIDGLIARENEIVSTMEDYYPQFKFRMGLISGKNETISHLKKLKEELN